jgi:hypothetical protein
MPFLLALAVGLVLTPLLALVGRRVGLVDHPTGDALKIHGEPKPLTGGLAVVPAALVSLAIFGDGLDPLVAAAVLLLLGVGVVDDARSAATDPAGRAAAAGIALAVSGRPSSRSVPPDRPRSARRAGHRERGEHGRRTGRLAAGLAPRGLGMTLILASAADPGSLGPRSGAPVSYGTSLRRASSSAMGRTPGAPRRAGERRGGFVGVAHRRHGLLRRARARARLVGGAPGDPPRIAHRRRPGARL